ncbi:MAG: hypothetical protein ACT4TC_15230 [Myxococcaceae bacterium]
MPSQPSTRELLRGFVKAVGGKVPVVDGLVLLRSLNRFAAKQLLEGES